MSAVKYISFTTEVSPVYPWKKVVISSVILVAILLVLILTFRESTSNTSNHHSGRYYSINEGEIFEINKSKSSYSKDEIILKRPVILLPQSPKKVPLKLVCYYSFPANSSDLQPDKIQNLCTHINIAFASINPLNYSIALSAFQLNIISQVINLKSLNKYLKVLISVGGAGPSNFDVMVVNHYHRKLFIRSLITLLKAKGLDGVDIDWEWPVADGHAKEKVQYIQLLYEIREELSRHKKQYVLSAAVSAIPSMIEDIYYVQYMAKYVDYVNLMGYDYHFYTDYYPVTDYNAPMYPSAKDNSYLATLNVNYSVYYWLQQGMPKGKLVLGMPIYGHSYKLFNGVNHGLHAPASGFGTIGHEGFASYIEICSFLSSVLTVTVMDNQTKVPYAYDFYNWISYEDETSLQYKAQYIVEQGLAGGMTYSLNTDDFLGSCSAGRTFPLHKLLQSILMKAS